MHNSLGEVTQQDTSKLLAKWVKIVNKKVSHSQVLLLEINKLSKQTQMISESSFNQTIPLTHLSMRTEIPKPLATYHPLIEDEFVPSKASTWRKEQKNSDKSVKRKVKALEKDNMKELKKDTA